ncbi:hypothetical protein ACAW74_18220 [Fibrella sp. WM1]|uniref:hypothetical protein n=1 Tax=Fibrella musci TaxID=3242485 RepID=UPI003520236D
MRILWIPKLVNFLVDTAIASCTATGAFHLMMKATGNPNMAAVVCIVMGAVGHVAAICLLHEARKWLIVYHPDVIDPPTDAVPGNRSD